VFSFFADASKSGFPWDWMIDKTAPTADLTAKENAFKAKALCEAQAGVRK